MNRGADLSERVSRICIGTAQFGMSYGITNRHGQVGPAAVSSILARAAGVGIDTLDTAAAYGDCEAVLGRVGVAGWRVVSKVPPLPESAVDPAVWVLESVERSLARLDLAQSRTGRFRGQGGAQ